MKHLATAAALSATFLLFGCSTAPAPAPMTSPSPSTTATPTPPSVTPVPGVGNWQFSGMSTLPGKPPFTFAGSITSQANSAVSGALHVNGSTCFNPLTTVDFTGTTTDDGASLTLTSTAVDGQVVTFIGKFTVTIPIPTYIGTYSINGGCDDGDQGSVTGFYIPYIANDLGGTFTSSTQKTFNVSGDIAQSAGADSEGSFAISGDATFDTPCFTMVTIKPGTFPSGSFILGMSVAFEFDTNNGILTFLGTLSQDRSQIIGNYSVTGGTCNDTGTAVLLVTSPWDY